MGRINGKTTSLSISSTEAIGRHVGETLCRIPAENEKFDMYFKRIKIPDASTPSVTERGSNISSALPFGALKVSLGRTMDIKQARYPASDLTLSIAG
jgi:hypothetical protein